MIDTAQNYAIIRTTNSDTRRKLVNRGVAQLGSASALGAEGRGFKSLRPDHLKPI